MKTTLKFILLFALNLIALSGYAQITAFSATDTHWNDAPQVDMEISLADSIVRSSDSLRVKITVTNKLNYTQKVLFGKAKYSVGPWAVTGDVTDQNGISVLSATGWNMLESQIYTKENIEKDKINIKLKPGESTSGIFSVASIVRFNASDNKLPPGRYNLRISYYKLSSGILHFTVKD
ncbi:MAG TPA: hypothetical protein VK668_06595 [Mucilaginibacter sp.]|nr:hypothetical protein [Mucilaginibacter sp.]